jgi:hypothetical protein
LFESEVWLFSAETLALVAALVEAREWHRIVKPIRRRSK